MTFRKNQKEPVIQKLQPYRKLIMPYLQAHNINEESIGASYIFDSLEDLYGKGVTHPVLLTNLAIVLGKAANTASAAMLFCIPGVWKCANEKIPKDAAKNAEEIAENRIGFNAKASGWNRLLRLFTHQPKPPSPDEVKTVVLEMFEKWENVSELKRINDEFARRYPLSI